MSKPEWGAKRACPSCGARFYDLCRNPAVCPSCETAYEPAEAVEPEGHRAEPEPEPVAPVPEPEVISSPEEAKADEDEEIIDLEAGEKPPNKEDFIEDASELGEDEDDMAEVLEGTVEDKAAEA